MMDYWIGVFIGIAFTLIISWGFGFLAIHKVEDDGHYHDWKVQGAQKLVSVTTYSGVPLQAKEDGSPITEVLYVCACGDTCTETLKGWWTVAMLRGESCSDVTTDQPEPETSQAETEKRIGWVEPREFDPIL